MKLLILKVANLLNTSQILLVAYFHPVYGLQIAPDEKKGTKREAQIELIGSLGGKHLSA